MNQYIRINEIVFKLIKQVFDVSGVSMDTKLIILVLAATMPKNKFARWINRLPRMNAFNAQFRQINAIRHMFGADCRNFILLNVMHYAQAEVCDAELQQLIALNSQESADDLHETIDLGIYKPKALMLFSESTAKT